MISVQRRLLTLTATALAFALPAAAGALSFDQNVTPDVIFGSGNANGAFTVDTNNGVELGLRAKLRFDAANNPQNIFNSNGDGTYSFAAVLPPSGFGFAPGSTSTAIWNFEWAINSDVAGTSGVALDDLIYEILIDFDPGLGTNFQAFDPINLAYADHAIGNNSTANGGGVSAPSNDTVAYAALIANNNVAQNSWNMEFFDNAGAGFPFVGDADGQYEFILKASDSNGLLASTQISVIVGAGAPIPEPSSALLFGAVLLSVSWRVRRGTASAA